MLPLSIYLIATDRGNGISFRNNSAGEIMIGIG
jgi:hypothetical protein